MVFFCTGWETDTGLVVVGRVSDDGSVGSGCSGERTTVTNLLLDAADDRSFRELAHGDNISNIEGSFLATVDEGTSVKTLGSNEGLFAELVTVWITEDDAGKRSAAARVMDNFLDNTANVAVPFGKVEGT